MACNADDTVIGCVLLVTCFFVYNQSMEKQTITVYTDGSSLGNPGPGGWGAVIFFGAKKVREIGGSDAETTNNKMELTAAIEAFRTIENEHGDVEVYTDSQYVKNGITGWVFGWKNRGWVTVSKEPVANKELWERLVDVEAKRKKIGAVLWHHVAGHVGHPGNERADTIATSFAKNEPPELFDGPAGVYTIDMTVQVDPKERADRSEKKKHSRAKAYSYLALVNGKVSRYATWGECEMAVKGKSAKYKKAISVDDEKNILKEWGVKG